MTLEELHEKLSFLYDKNVEKNISIYATTPTTPLCLFNIEDQFLHELKKMFIEEIKEVTDNQSPNFTLENYSSSTKQLDAIFQYDLQEDLRPEMQFLKDVKTLENPELFVIKPNNSIDQVNGLYIVIRSANHVISLYKHVFGVDKIYAQNIDAIYCIWSNSNFNCNCEVIVMTKVEQHDLLINHKKHCLPAVLFRLFRYNDIKINRNFIIITVLAFIFF